MATDLRLVLVLFGTLGLPVACGNQTSPTPVADGNPTGAATRNVSANNALLTEIVPTPGSGIEPGLAFTVSANGQIAP